MEGIAQAQPNIALVKYWGKQSGNTNVPATPSLSITLNSLWTRTRVRFGEDRRCDQLSINGIVDPAQFQRVTKCLDTLRQITGIRLYADVVSENNFPTSAGIASSASGFAALVTAACVALDADLDLEQRSRLARRSSASAARSIFGGFAELDIEAQDPAARPLLTEHEWPLHVLVAITSTQPKSIGSTMGMTQSAETSEYYDDWVHSASDDFAAARQAVLTQDFEMLADISEANCLKMHAVMLTTRPALIYWNGATVETIHCVRALRAQGLPVFFTIDAGPQVKVISLPGYRNEIERAVKDIPGVMDTIHSELGPGARAVSAGPPGTD